MRISSAIASEGFVKKAFTPRSRLRSDTGWMKEPLVTKKNILANALLMQLLWFIAVRGAASGFADWAILPLLMMLVPGCAAAYRWRQDLLMLMVAVAVGFVFEVLLINSGLIVYQGATWAGLPPIWVLILWAGLGMSCNYSLRWVGRHRGLAVLVGAAGGILSLRSGIALGAGHAPRGLLPLMLVYGVGWALTMPLLAGLSREVRDVRRPVV